MNKRIYILVITLLVINNLQIKAQKYSVSGFVQDKINGEKLIGANVYNKQTLNGTISNSFGFYSLSVSANNIDIVFSYVGYQNTEINLHLTKDTVINIYLVPGSKIEEVTVKSTGNISKIPQISMLKITAKEIKKLPSLTGDADIMKAYQLMPGISQGNEGTNGMYVRGGSPDQNLILLDDVPLYYVNHVGGFVSVFNENAINDIKVYKGGFPARYGGRLSSVIDIRMKDGNMKKTSGEVFLGLINSKLSVEGPIIKNKMSYNISVRRSMLDLALKPISRKMMSNNGYASYMFYDINAKINYKLSENDRLYFSTYNGNDNIITEMATGGSNESDEIDTASVNYDYQNLMQNKWGNSILCFRWNHIYNSKLFSNLTLAGGNFAYNSLSEIVTENMDLSKIAKEYSTKYSSGINDRIAKIDFDYFPSNNHKIKMGAMLNLHNFNPGKIERLYKIDTTALTDSVYLINGYPDEIDTTYGSQALNALETSVYFEDEYNITKKLSINAGLHFSSYSTSDTNFYSFQPRLIVNYELNSISSLKFSYALMKQYMHMLTGSNANMPTDIWMPATRDVLPEKSMQITGGYVRNINLLNLEFSIEGFYKTLSNLIEYKSGESLTTGTKLWTEKIEKQGTGKIYGLELLLRKNQGKLNGWISYTLSKNERQFFGIDNNVAFPYKFDRRHDFSVVTNYKVKENISISASWIIQSGIWITLGSAKYDAMVFNNSNDISNRQEVIYESETYRHDLIEYAFDNAYIYGTKNNYRLPTYHKLDISATFTKQKKHGTRDWIISIYNVYNQKNTYRVYYKVEKGKISLYKFTLFPIIPSVSYRFTF